MSNVIEQIEQQIAKLSTKAARKNTGIIRTIALRFKDALCVSRARIYLCGCSPFSRIAQHTSIGISCIPLK